MGRQNPLKKAALVLAGSLCLVLGVLGVFLPLLPATPFLLLASACYVRSSERLHRRLMESRLLGSYVRNIQQRRGLPLRAKIVTVAVLWLSLLYSIYRLDALVYDLLLVGCGLTSSFFILRMKTLREGE